MWEAALYKSRLSSALLIIDNPARATHTEWRTFRYGQGRSHADVQHRNYLRWKRSLGGFPHRQESPCTPVGDRQRQVPRVLSRIGLPDEPGERLSKYPDTWKHPAVHHTDSVCAEQLEITRQGAGGEEGGGFRRRLRELRGWAGVVFIPFVHLVLGLRRGRVRPQGRAQRLGPLRPEGISSSEEGVLRRGPALPGPRQQSRPVPAAPDQSHHPVRLRHLEPEPTDGERGGAPRPSRAAALKQGRGGRVRSSGQEEGDSRLNGLTGWRHIGEGRDQSLSLLPRQRYSFITSSCAHKTRRQAEKSLLPGHKETLHLLP